MKKALVAMSGGVDSSVAAAFMKEKGYEVIGVTMKLYDNEDIHIREKAKAYNLLNAGKKDSQDICFIPDGNHKKFIEKYTGEKIGEGNFVDIHGKVVGHHQGYYRYTIGQRKGINVNREGKNYVLEIRPETNEVVVEQLQKLKKIKKTY